MAGEWGDRELGLFHASKYLVHQVLAGYSHRQHRDLYDDMHSYGLIGLWHAIDSYEDGGGSFRIWAKSKIAWAIKDGLRELDLITRNNRTHIKHLTEAHNDLSQRLGSSPTWEQLRDHGVAVEKAVRAAWFAKQDEPIYDDWLNEFTTPGPESILIQHDEEQRMGRHISRLPTQMSVIVELMYYGEYEQQEVGEILGVSASRISQIHKAAMKRLRTMVGDEFRVDGWR